MQVAALRTRRADQSWPARPAQATKELLMYAKRNRLGGRLVDADVWDFPCGDGVVNRFADILPQHYI